MKQWKLILILTCLGLTQNYNLITYTYPKLVLYAMTLIKTIIGKKLSLF